MDSEGKRNQRIRRRERAQQLQQQKQQQNHVADGSGDEEEDSPPRPARGKSKSKPSKRRPSSSGQEEDIIDGFSITSFKSLEDLEVSDFGTSCATQRNQIPTEGIPCTFLIFRVA